MQGEATRVPESFGRRRAIRGGVTETPAYRGGWRDGRFEPVETFATNRNLAVWEGMDRLYYYRGYRDGLRIRRMLRGS